MTQGKRGKTRITSKPIRVAREPKEPDAVSIKKQSFGEAWEHILTVSRDLGITPAKTVVRFCLYVAARIADGTVTTDNFRPKW
jgi:hypothetical protein